MAYAPGDRCPLCGGTLRVAKGGEGLVCTSCGLAVSGVQLQRAPAVKQAPEQAAEPRKSVAEKRPICPCCREPFQPELTQAGKVTVVSCANCHIVAGVIPKTAPKRTTRRKKK